MSQIDSLTETVPGWLTWVFPIGGDGFFCLAPYSDWLRGPTSHPVNIYQRALLLGV